MMANFPRWLFICYSPVCCKSFVTAVLARPLCFTTNTSLGVCKQNCSMILDGEIVEAMLFIVLIFEMSHELTIKKKKNSAVCSVASHDYNRS